MTQLMDEPDVICARCDRPIQIGEPYSDYLVAVELFIVVCPACGVKK